MFDVEAALRELVAKEGSDLHLKVGSKPLFRVDGNLAAEQDGPVLSAEDTQRALETLLTQNSKLDEFAQQHEVDFSFEIPERRPLPPERVPAARRDLDGRQGDPAQDQHDRGAGAA